MNTEKITEALFHFLDHSPTAYHAAEQVCRMLEAAGYEHITDETQHSPQPGGKYYLTRNASSVIAFRLPAGCAEKLPSGLRISAAHGDSPCFKVKENPEMAEEGYYVRLNTEKYSGTIQYAWMDRPLSIAGRVVVEEGKELVPRLVCFERPLCVIPSVSMHYNRNVNDGCAYNAQVDLLPLFAAKTEEGEDNSLLALCAGQLGVKKEQILGADLYLYVPQKAQRIGAVGEYIGSPRLDDQHCAFATFAGFLGSDETSGAQAEIFREGMVFSGETDYIPMYVLFDNEEIGSNTKQGADSTFLSDAIDCICDALALDGKQKRRLLSGSFLLSADNAHAVHPNHPEKSDPTARPLMNHGVVLKFQSSQRYTTDAWSGAVIRRICRDAGIPLQILANRSDMVGGATLANISSSHVSIPSADVGLPQLAMHSAYETAGVKDTEYLVALCREFFQGK